MTIELLTAEQMKQADDLAVSAGVSNLALMEKAGLGVAEVIRQTFPYAKKVIVVCGSGNNGGDGFVAARYLKQMGYDVRLLLYGKIENISADSARMALKWEGGIEPLTPVNLKKILTEDTFIGPTNILVDALFGVGLNRPLSSDIGDCIDLINSSRLHVVAVDVPSGIDATKGVVTGKAVQADLTVTFFRRKTGHLLMPARQLCWDVKVIDIGISPRVLDVLNPTTFCNTPALWFGQYPWPEQKVHKYNRGHAVVVSGPVHATGAARLGARAALRIGAGLVTVASLPEALHVNACHLTAIMLQDFKDAASLAEFLKDKKRNSVLIGPAAGVNEQTKSHVDACLQSGIAVVLDADALSCYAKETERLIEKIRALPDRPVVLTPHEGEFSRVFETAEMEEFSKLEKARHVAKETGACVVLKGPDTVIADPDGRAAINENAPSWLATAGSGDVLAGLICGLLAQGMPSFEAACAAVWIHGAAAQKFGPGLIAEDLTEIIPSVLREDLGKNDYLAVL